MFIVYKIWSPGGGHDGTGLMKISEISFHRYQNILEGEEFKP